MRLRIESMAYGFDAVSHDDSGKTVFVSGGVPGDIVEAQLVSDGKTFSRAQVGEVLEASPSRVKSPCPYAEVCGGCPWSNMSYELQAQAKRKNVVDALVRIGHVDADTAESLVRPIESPSEPWGYRNKIELAISRGPRGVMLGMHARADEAPLVNVDKCLLLPKAHQKLPRSVAGGLRFLCGSDDLGIERVGMRVSERTRQVEVALWTDPAAFPRSQVTKVLTDSVKPTSIARVLMKEGGAARKVSGVERLAGKGMWDERVAGGRMSLSAPSFFQVNTAGAERLVELVLDGLAPDEDEVAVDLYCGAGTFTLPLAQRCAAVVGVESYGPAVRDLAHNVQARGLSDAVDVIGDDAARQLDELEDAGVVVVDPPRAGLARDVVDALSDSPARAVAYVSCDPATLARDLEAFGQAGQLVPESVTPVDLFPQTFHVETVTILRR